MMSNSAKHNSQTTGSSRRRVWLIVALGVVLFASIAVVWVVKEVRKVTAEAASGTLALPDYGRVVDFALTESSGKPVTLGSLKGTIWIANFIFTSCTGPCPQMSRRMADLQNLLESQQDIRLVSISVDPERDTPAVLGKYAEEYGARPKQWWFLTGHPMMIKRVAIDGFHIGSIDDPLLHSTKFILVDGQGHIRGYYDSMSPEAIQLLLTDIDRLSSAAVL